MKPSENNQTTKTTGTKEYPGAPDNFGWTTEAPVHTNLTALTKNLPAETLLAQHAQNCRITGHIRTAGGI
ncbi:MAG TPA: hypothetical protein O0X39_07675 [Methanocorpusculum sp.]|nr:hypothetical protein [Methanocorpusculum sp.]